MQAPAQEEDGGAEDEETGKEVVELTMTESAGDGDTGNVDSTYVHHSCRPHDGEVKGLDRISCLSNADATVGS